MKKTVSLLMCLITIFTLAVPALATVPALAAEYDGGNIEPMYDIEYYINADSVNLRSGPGTQYSSGGLVNNGDILVRRLVDGSYYHYDSNGNQWISVRMITGSCATLNGYILSSYVSSRKVPGIEY